MFLVFISCSGEKEAKKIALKLLEKRLVVCANIVPKISSFYWWKGKIESQNEALLLCKTLGKKNSQIKSEVKKIHGYEVPCIEFIKIAGQNAECREWMEKELGKAQTKK